jgi:hypothetical protein
LAWQLVHTEFDEEREGHFYTSFEMSAWEYLGQVSDPIEASLRFWTSSRPMILIQCEQTTRNTWLRLSRHLRYLGSP